MCSVQFLVFIVCMQHEVWPSVTPCILENTAALYTFQGNVTFTEKYINAVKYSTVLCNVTFMLQ